MFAIAKNERSGYARARAAVLVITVIADVICSLFLNVMGGIGLALNNYQKAGYSLIASAAVLTLAIIFLRRGGMVIPSVLCAAGTALYIYPIRVLDSIPHTLIPKQNIEPLMQRIYPAVSVTVLLVIMIVFNYFSDEQINKREARRRAKYEREDRKLRNDEKII